MIQARRLYFKNQEHADLAQRLLEELLQGNQVISETAISRIRACRSDLLSDQKDNRALFKERKFIGLSFSSFKKTTIVFLKTISIGSLYALTIFDQIRKKDDKNRDHDLEKIYLTFMFLTCFISCGIEISGVVKFLSRKYKLMICKDNFARNVLISDLSRVIEVASQRQYSLDQLQYCLSRKINLKIIKQSYEPVISLEQIIIFPCSEQNYLPTTADVISNGLNSLESVNFDLIPFCEAEKEVEPLFSRWHELLEDMFSIINSIGRVIAFQQRIPQLDQWLNSLQHTIKEMEIQYKKAQSIYPSFTGSLSGLCSYKKISRLKLVSLIAYPLQFVGLIEFARYVNQETKNNLFTIGLLVFTAGWLLGEFGFYLSRKVYRYMILSYQIEMVISEYYYIELAKNTCEIFSEWIGFLKMELVDRKKGEELIVRIKEEITCPFDRALCVSDLTRRIEEKITVDIED